ncbi:MULTISPECIES: IS66 family transposase [Lactobacillus]|uniref:IS66 family transposase n=1 Tax=Lactobacillus xujianguonis TaxID=2495899 RepID=A0A437STG5_9LACO|nr:MULTISPECIES: IS66 family transposase [Lactobacillus]RVU70229.1 IS66 family transposase [Lactobacillus xujianguonis]RVU73371.1 IS66 family transposase [Lactobacillus xujianguonis]
MAKEDKDQTITQLKTIIQNMSDEIKLLREQVAYLTQKLYGKSSEQMPLNGQTSLFDEPEAQDDGERPRRRRSDYYL